MPAGTPVQVRFPDEELEALDGYRREQRNPPSRAQAIRELMRIVLMTASSSVFNGVTTESAVGDAHAKRNHRSPAA
jgi:hypothetical protein